MKTFYLDTEFNGFLGRMISMALVSDNLDIEFYEVLFPNTYCNPNGGIPLDPWVKKNVIPILNKDPITVSEFQFKLEKFLMNNAEDGIIRIVADWPEDLTHFCKMLITGPGHRISLPELELVYKPNIHYDSKIPHNALEDARAIARTMVLNNSKYYD